MTLFSCADISFSYRPAAPVLRGLNLELESGHFYGIMGPNGCGKTTLLDLLTGYLRPETGLIRFAGRNLNEYSKSELARRLALVPQFYDINFPYTAAEIILMGRYPHQPRFSTISAGERALVTGVMRATDTACLKSRLVTELSGGERQRVVFARALVQDTAVLFLDEATANLDINHALRLLSLVKNRVEQKKLTAVAVFQDINLAAAFCDRLIFLRRGEVVSEGETGKVLQPETIKAVFGVEARIFTDPDYGRRQTIFKIQFEEEHL